MNAFGSFKPSYSSTDEEAKEHAFYEERGMPVPKKEIEGDLHW